MKGEEDPVTRADKDCQILIEATLAKLFPGLKVIGEEDVELDLSRALDTLDLSLIDESILPEDRRTLPVDRL
jgi:fructose-1,6-bisphosphatase/inositol monophosphatase family enzyme